MSGVHLINISRTNSCWCLTIWNTFRQRRKQ